MKKKRKKRIWIPILLVVIVVGGVLLYQSDLFDRQRYPLEYTDDISTYSGEYSLDPYLVAAMIRTESDFQPDAVSPAGAMGLMQIMPDTASWIAEKLGRADFTDSMLFDPATNIQFGCWYLHFLTERFDSPELIAAAYNAGHNRVTAWLEDENISGDGRTLTNIPFEETRNYVDRIDRAYEKYRKYYPDVF